VRETIGNYLQSYLSPEVADVFGAADKFFDLDSIDQGKIVLVSMPQKLLTERRYVSTFLKLLFYSHVLRRFDKLPEERARENLLLLWADEAQRFMTAGEDGVSDYNCVDVIREANATVIAATQSTTSFLPPLGPDKSKVLILNLRNRLLFRAADEQDALQSADFLGKRHVVRKQWGFTGGKSTVTYSVAEEHRLKPHELRRLRDHECVLVHCERGYRKVTLAPLTGERRVPDWFSSWRAWPTRVLRRLEFPS
jgi:type IV secretory pathway TraG/TraD family ATPase VirD4